MLPTPGEIRKLKRPKRKNTIEDMQDLAATYGGRCLSKIYRNMSEKLVWQCENDHEWEATPDRVRNAKQWCPECDRDKRKLEQLEVVKKRAIELHGVCLEEEFDTGVTKMSFKCHLDHEFMLTPAKLLRGDWCPICEGLDND